MTGKKNKSKYKKHTHKNSPENTSDAPVIDEAVSDVEPNDAEPSATIENASIDSANIDSEGTSIESENVSEAQPTASEIEHKDQEQTLPEDIASATTAIQDEALDSDSEVNLSADGATAAITQASVAPKSEKKSNNILALITLVLLLLFAAVAAYFAWQFWQQNDQRLQTIESQTTEQKTQLSSSDSQQLEQLASQKAALAELQKKLTQQQTVLQQRVDSHAQRLRSLAGTSRDDWLLAEARYLLRLANQRLLMNGGAAGALGLLESADKILVSMDAPDLFPIRDAVAKDMVALKLAPSVDREGLYLQLAAVKGQLAQLPGVPLVRPKHEAKSSVDESVDSDTPTPWYGTLWSSVTKVFSGLDRYIRVRDHNETTEPLLTDAQQQQMTYSLHLMLEQSQLALLREEEKVYRQSLAQAITWLNAHYKHYSEKGALVEEIARLQNATIIQQLPDISGSLEMLTDYIDRYHKITPENATQQKAQPALKRLPKGERKKTDTKKIQTIPQIFKKLEKKASPVKQGEAL